MYLNFTDFFATVDSKGYINQKINFNRLTDDLMEVQYGQESKPGFKENLKISDNNDIIYVVAALKNKISIIEAGINSIFAQDTIESLDSYQDGIALNLKQLESTLILLFSIDFNIRKCKEFNTTLELCLINLFMLSETNENLELALKIFYLYFDQVKTLKSDLAKVFLKYVLFNHKESYLTWLWDSNSTEILENMVLESTIDTENNLLPFKETNEDESEDQEVKLKDNFLDNFVKKRAFIVRKLLCSNFKTEYLNFYYFIRGKFPLEDITLRKSVNLNLLQNWSSSIEKEGFQKFKKCDRLYSVISCIERNDFQIDEAEIFDEIFEKLFNHYTKVDNLEDYSFASSFLLASKNLINPENKEKYKFTDINLQLNEESSLEIYIKTFIRILEYQIDSGDLIDGKVFSYYFDRLKLAIVKEKFSLDSVQKIQIVNIANFMIKAKSSELKIHDLYFQKLNESGLIEILAKSLDKGKDILFIFNQILLSLFKVSGESSFVKENLVHLRKIFKFAHENKIFLFLNIFKHYYDQENEEIDFKSEIALEYFLLWGKKIKKKIQFNSLSKEMVLNFFTQNLKLFKSSFKSENSFILENSDEAEIKGIWMNFLMFKNQIVLENLNYIAKKLLKLEPELDPKLMTKFIKTIHIVTCSLGNTAPNLITSSLTLFSKFFDLPENSDVSDYSNMIKSQRISLMNFFSNKIQYFAMTCNRILNNCDIIKLYTYFGNYKKKKTEFYKLLSNSYYIEIKEILYYENLCIFMKDVNLSDEIYNQLREDLAQNLFKIYTFLPLRLLCISHQPLLNELVEEKGKDKIVDSMLDSSILQHALITSTKSFIVNLNKYENLYTEKRLEEIFHPLSFDLNIMDYNPPSKYFQIYVEFMFFQELSNNFEKKDFNSFYFRTLLFQMKKLVKICFTVNILDSKIDYKKNDFLEKFLRQLINFISDSIIPSVEYFLFRTDDFEKQVIVCKEILRHVITIWANFKKDEEQISELISNSFQNCETNEEGDCKDDGNKRFNAVNSIISELFLVSTYEHSARIRSCYYYDHLKKIWSHESNKEKKIREGYVALFIELSFNLMKFVCNDFKSENCKKLNEFYQENKEFIPLIGVSKDVCCIENMPQNIAISTSAMLFNVVARGIQSCYNSGNVDIEQGIREMFDDLPSKIEYFKFLSSVCKFGNSKYLTGTDRISFNNDIFLNYSLLFRLINIEETSNDLKYELLSIIVEIFKNILGMQTFSAECNNFNVLHEIRSTISLIPDIYNISTYLPVDEKLYNILNPLFTVMNKTWIRDSSNQSSEYSYIYGLYQLFIDHSTKEFKTLNLIIKAKEFLESRENNNENTIGNFLNEFDYYSHDVIINFFQNHCIFNVDDDYFKNVKFELKIDNEIANIKSIPFFLNKIIEDILNLLIETVNYDFNSNLCIANSIDIYRMNGMHFLLLILDFILNIYPILTNFLLNKVIDGFSRNAIKALGLKKNQKITFFDFTQSLFSVLPEHAYTFFMKNLKYSFGDSQNMKDKLNSIISKLIEEIKIESKLLIQKEKNESYLILNQKLNFLFAIIKEKKYNYFTIAEYQKMFEPLSDVFCKVSSIENSLTSLNNFIYELLRLIAGKVNKVTFYGSFKDKVESSFLKSNITTLQYLWSKNLSNFNLLADQIKVPVESLLKKSNSLSINILSILDFEKNISLNDSKILLNVINNQLKLIDDFSKNSKAFKNELQEESSKITGIKKLWSYITFTSSASILSQSFYNPTREGDDNLEEKVENLLATLPPSSKKINVGNEEEKETIISDKVECQEEEQKVEIKEDNKEDKLSKNSDDSVGMTEEEVRKALSNVYPVNYAEYGIPENFRELYSIDNEQLEQLPLEERIQYILMKKENYDNDISSEFQQKLLDWGYPADSLALYNIDKEYIIALPEDIQKEILTEEKRKYDEKKSQEEKEKLEEMIHSNKIEYLVHRELNLMGQEPDVDKVVDILRRAPSEVKDVLYPILSPDLISKFPKNIQETIVKEQSKSKSSRENFQYVDKLTQSVIESLSDLKNSESNLMVEAETNEIVKKYSNIESYFSDSHIVQNLVLSESFIMQLVRKTLYEGPICKKLLKHLSKLLWNPINAVHFFDVIFTLAAISIENFDKQVEIKEFITKLGVKTGAEDQNVGSTIVNHFILIIKKFSKLLNFMELIYRSKISVKNGLNLKYNRLSSLKNMTSDKLNLDIELNINEMIDKIGNNLCKDNENTDIQTSLKKFMELYKKNKKQARFIDTYPMSYFTKEINEDAISHNFIMDYINKDDRIRYFNSKDEEFLTDSRENFIKVFTMYFTHYVDLCESSFEKVANNFNEKIMVTCKEKLGNCQTFSEMHDEDEIMVTNLEELIRSPLNETFSDSEYNQHIGNFGKIFKDLDKYKNRVIANELIIAQTEIVSKITNSSDIIDPQTDEQKDILKILKEETKRIKNEISIEICDIAKNSKSLNNFFKNSSDLFHKLQKLLGNLESFRGNSSNKIDDIFCRFRKIMKILNKIYDYIDEEEKFIHLESSAPKLAKLMTREVQAEGKTLSKKFTTALSQYNDIPDAINLIVNHMVEVVNLVLRKESEMTKFKHLVLKSDFKEKFDIKLRMNLMRDLIKQKYASHPDYSEDTTYIKIEREHPWNSTVNEFLRLSPMKLAGTHIKIEFVDEPGSDYGGLTREWLALVCEEILSPEVGLFELSSNKTALQPNKLSYIVPDHLTHFRCFGRLLGKVILSDLNMQVNFIKSFLKHLTGANLVIRDLEDMDPDLCKSLEWILDNDIEDDIFAFAIEENFFGMTKVYDLIPEGSTIYANNSNKKEYVKEMASFKMGKSIDEQTKAIQLGIYEIIPSEFFKLIDYKELGIFLVGDQKINVEEMIEFLSLDDSNEKDSDIINFLKQFLREVEQKTLSKFIFFCTGAFKIPIGGFRSFPLQVEICGSEDSLPVAHTCFNKIDLPRYPTYEIMKDKIQLAINEGGRGFFII